MAIATDNVSQHRQFVLFILTGGFAALVNFFSRMLFSHWVPFSIAILLAYACGMVTAFTLNRLIVFRQARNALHQQIFWFVMVNVAAALQTLIVSLALVDWVFPQAGFKWHTETIAHAIGVAVPVVTSYIGHKYLSFRGG